MPDNFIGIYENAFAKEYCELVIAYFNDMEKAGCAKNRMEADDSPKNIKDDLAVFAHSFESVNFQSSGNLLSIFNQVFWEKYKEYNGSYAILTNTGKHNNYSFKIQKTPIGGGFHTWHFESSGRETCHRLLTWALYLNDVEEGGETEFLYQHVRVKPKQGTLIIWPAAFTHTHRGNPPLSNEKYIVTGWTEF